MKDKKDLYRISEKLYHSIEVVDNQETYKALLNIYELTNSLNLDEIRRVIIKTTKMIEDYCCDLNICPYCGEKLNYNSVCESDTDSYYNRYYYCNECRFKKDID